MQPRFQTARSPKEAILPVTLSTRARLVAVLVATVALASCTSGSTTSLPPGVSPSGAPLPPPPPICPLTGLAPSGGKVPNRPTLAVKVENVPVARPQTGLSFADIIYEEPVEGGITRFIVVYQCHDASRIEPIRSARLTDPDVLVQFGHALFANSGGVPQVFIKVRRAGLIDLNYTVPKASGAYHRDPNRPAPHNLYSSTKELYRAAGVAEEPPEPVFNYSSDSPNGRRIRSIHLPFSGVSDVFWRWSSAKQAYLRSHGTVPHTYSDGTQVAAVNVVVQVSKIVITNITDVAGVPSPEVVATGEGKAYILRGGRMIIGTWKRPSLRDLTKYYDAQGNEVSLLPGNTWVELFPNTLTVTYRK
jgi:Protein of unknown function (DUF3048) N-terminal domain/Protein of unknown function (DUF3048) C-terminal domain